jgi:carboxyl-terminal processing protease
MGKISLNLEETKLIPQKKASKLFSTPLKIVQASKTMKQSPTRPNLWQRLIVKSAIATLTLGAVVTPYLTPAARATLEDSPKTVVDEVWQIVHNEFVDRNFNQVDWQVIRQDLLSREYSSKQEAYRVVRETLKQLGDPYTRFLTPSEFEVLTSQTSGELSGIGLRLEIDQQTNMLSVVEPIENSPAIKAGLKAGDKILKINDKPTALMTIDQASEEIRGEVGTEVKLQVSRSGQKPFELTVVRAQIELPSVSYHIKEEGQIKVGYIKLDEFSSHAAEQMKKAIQKLEAENASAFVLDLRGNPGGLLFASVDIARMWLDSGAIVKTTDRRGGDRQFSANHTALTKLPLVVLVDENSASASEILAGALKDNKRATVVGTRTFGKGTVQSVHSLSDGSGLAVTISRYYPPSGINISQKGIAPDITIDLTQEQQFNLQSNPTLIGTNADPQYKKAISFLQTTGLGQISQPPQPVSIR